MIDREAFVASRADRWRDLDDLLLRGARSPEEWSTVAALYRGVCADLATARGLGVPADVQAHLDDLAGRAHNVLYSVRPAALGRSILSDALHGFPRELRAQLGFFLLATLLFYGPFALGVVGCLADPGFAARIVPVGQLEAMEEAYSGELARGFGGDAAMAGFYVWNNVGIAFRVFATGVMFGVGSMFYLVYNGLVIGTVIGYVSGAGQAQNLFLFVMGHSAWELTGVCVAGAAGLRMGWALVSTGGRTRLGSLRQVGPTLYRLVLGTTVMLLIAAAIEGFWSAGPVPPAGKIAFALLQVLIVGLWLTLGGRRRFT